MNVLDYDNGTPTPDDVPVNWIYYQDPDRCWCGMRYTVHYHTRHDTPDTRRLLLAS